MGSNQKDAELLKSKLKHLLENDPFYVNGDSMKTQTQWEFLSAPKKEKELLSLINLSRNRITQKAIA